MASKTDSGTPEGGFRPSFGPKDTAEAELGAEPDRLVEPPSRRNLPDEPAAKATRLPDQLRATEADTRMVEVARLRVEGLSVSAIARQLHVPRKVVVADSERWLAEQAPSEEQTESLRQLMMERLESLHATWWKAAHGQFEDRWGRQVPNDKAAELLLKIQDRQARLMGLDLQPNTQTVTVTAESVALFLGWDGAGGGAVGVQASLPRGGSDGAGQ